MAEPLNTLNTVIADIPGNPLAAPVERASLRAWPAIVEMSLATWLLRFSDGYTRRVNCATPYGPATSSLADEVFAAETISREHGLPPIFRLAEPWSGPEIDFFLEQRCYERADLTHVLALDLLNRAVAGSHAEIWQARDLTQWMSGYARAAGQEQEHQSAHRRIVEAATGTRLYVCAGPKEDPEGCCLGILDGEMLGLFDLAVRPHRRRQGLGTALVCQLLYLATHRGARYAYLQVTDGNSAARRLYDRIGFRPLYRYWYRQHGRDQSTVLESPVGGLEANATQPGSSGDERDAGAHTEVDRKGPGAPSGSDRASARDNGLGHRH